MLKHNKKIKVMQNEIKELLVEELKAVKNARIKVALGFGLGLLITILSISGVVQLINLVILIPIFLLIRKSIKELNLSLMMLDFTRVLIDDEYGNEFKS